MEKAKLTLHALKLSVGISYVSAQGLASERIAELLLPTSQIVSYIV